MLSKHKNNKLDSIYSLLRRELGRLAKDFTHIESAGDVYRAVLKNGHRVLIFTNQDDKRRDMTEVGSRMEIFRSHVGSRSKWLVPAVLWEYTTPNVLVQTWLNHPTLSDIIHHRHRGAVARKYIVRYLLTWFVEQIGVFGHFLREFNLDDFFVATGNQVGCNNFLNAGFLEPKERRLFAALSFALLKGERQLAVKMILAQHYREIHPHHVHKSGLHLTAKPKATVGQELRSILTSTQAGNISVSDSLREAAVALRSLEKMIHVFDGEADFNGNLFSILQAQLPAIFKLKKDASPKEVAAAVMD